MKKLLATIFSLFVSAQLYAQTATPTLSPAGGSSTNYVNVTANDATSNVIYAITDDGSTPTISSGVVTHGLAVYQYPFTVSRTSTIKVVAGTSGQATSAVATYNFTITGSTSQTVSPCSSGFNTTTSGPSQCGVSVNGLSADFWLANHPSTVLVGTQAQLAALNAGHQGNSLIRQAPVYVGAFSATFQFQPNAENVAFVVENDYEPSQSQAPWIMSSGAGGEGGFSQFAGGSNVPPVNVFALKFSTVDSLTKNTSFTHSSAQIFQTLQPPYQIPQTCCTYLGQFSTNQYSTAPVSLNNPTTTVSSPSSDTFSATINYDGSTLTLNLFDVTAGGACPGSNCFTQTWNNVFIPDIVGGDMAYIGLMAGTSGISPNEGQAINIPAFTYTTQPATGTPTTTAWNANSTYTSGSYPSTVTGTGAATSAASPVYSVAPGSYASAQSVGITTSTSPHNYICYLTSATTPIYYPQPDNNGGCSTGTLYTGPITISSTTTLYSMAGSSNAGFPSYNNGGSVDNPAGLGPPSSLVAGTYTIGSTPTVATPTFTPVAGTYSSTQTVTISTSTTGGAALCYTTDGSTPTSSGTACTHGTSLVNNGTVSVSTTQTLNAIGYLSGDAISAVATATYNISGLTVTTISLTNPSFCYVSQPCLQTATMGTSAATGTVSFYNGTTLLGTGTLSGGVATYTATLPFGDQNLNATYSGDSTYAPITAPSYNNQLVLLNTTKVVLKSSATTAASGASITLTATVTSTSSSGTPTGYVLFYDGNTVLGGAQVPLSGGVATYSSSSLNSGQHYIQAVYLGDNANYAEGHSLIVNQTITTTTASCAPTLPLTNYTNVYYVANNGSDTGGTGTCASPYLTVGKATTVIGSNTNWAILLREGDSFTETVTINSNCSSTSKCALSSYVGTGLTSSSSPPVITARSTLAGTWTLVTGTTYSIPYTGYPSKMYVDSTGQESTIVKPAINWLGNYSAGSFNPYDSVYSVTANGNYFSRLTAITTSGGFNANNQSWGSIPTVPVSMQVSGLTNVENNSNFFYCNGTNCYINLSDGSNPNSHTIQATVRKYVLDLRGSSGILISNLSLEGPTFTGIDIIPTSSSSANTEDSITVQNDFVYDAGNPLVSYDFPNEGSYYTGNVVMAPYQVSGTPYAITNTTLSGNVFGKIDVFEQLNYNVESVNSRGTTNFLFSNNLISSSNGEGLAFQSYNVNNTNAAVMGNNFINNQGGVRVSGAPGAILTNNTFHHGLGFGIQVGGGSTNVQVRGALIFNLRSTRGKTDILTPGVPGGGGTLFNGLDCNGTGTGLTTYHMTIYNIGGNAMTNEYTSDGLGSGACDKATHQDNLLDASVEVRPDTTYGTGAYSFWVKYQSQPPTVWSYNGTVPYVSQPSNFDWKNSSGGDIAIGFGQMDLNANGVGDIQASSSNFTNPIIGDFSLASGSPFCNTGTPISVMGDTPTPNIGYTQNSCTVESPGSLNTVSIWSGYPNSSAFGFNTLGVGTRIAFAAVGSYADGSTRSLSGVTWNSSNPSGASIGNYSVSTSNPVNGGVATNGTFGIGTALTTGSTNITGSYGGVSSSNYPLTLTAGTPIPTASPIAGSYSSSQSVVLTSTDSSASIYYTLNGTTPTSTSTLYTAPILISSTTTLSVIGYNSSGPYTSSVGTYQYSIGASPTLSGASSLTGNSSIH
jgi:hypothetical protein